MVDPALNKPPIGFFASIAGDPSSNMGFTNIDLPLMIMDGCIDGYR